ncbi:MAG: hypothetical protein HC840_25400 [Leptolyngbyaceae cyanobacterium RM2_2_4]|nr:hypothetical protein [Leptolyngbyaceae cyanobacterium RM2_2_4]
MERNSQLAVQPLEGQPEVRSRRRDRTPVALYATLLPPLLWMTLLYFVPIAILISYSFWRLEAFDIVREFSLVNFQTIFGNAAYRTVIVRTVMTALGGDSD